MIDSIEWLRIFILEHRSFEFIIIFIGTIIGGKLAIFSLGFLAGQHVLSIFSVILFVFTGMLLSNTFWFFVARTKLIKRLIVSRYTNKTTSMITEALVRLSRNKYLVALTMIEFSIGTPIILTTYLSKVAINLKRFLLYQSIVISISILVIIPFGFASGLGFSYLISIFNNLYTTISFILLIVMAIVVVQTWLRNRITEELVDEKNMV